jgi:hypothetical protein
MSFLSIHLSEWGRGLRFAKSVSTSKSKIVRITVLIERYVARMNHSVQLKQRDYDRGVFPLYTIGNYNH